MPLSSAPIPIDIVPVANVPSSVLSDVGANARLDCSGRWVSVSDRTDSRILAAVRSAAPRDDFARAPYESEIPRRGSSEPCADGDKDGMPDAWESSQGLDPHRNDASGTRPGVDVTNIEAYLNGQ